MHARWDSQPEKTAHHLRIAVLSSLALEGLPPCMPFTFALLLTTADGVSRSLTPPEHQSCLAEHLHVENPEAYSQQSTEYRPPSQGPSFLGMSFTGHAAVLLRPQDTDFKAATLPGKTFAAHWLKGSTLATLSLGVQGTEHLLALYIRDQAVIRCSSVLCTILSPEDTGQGWVLLGAPTWSKPYQVIGHPHLAEVSRLSDSCCTCAIILTGVSSGKKPN